jgi:hypothetical protein
MPERYRLAPGRGVTPERGREHLDAPVVVAAGARHDGGVSTSPTRDEQATAVPTGDPDGPHGPWWRRVDKTLLLVSFVVAVGVMIVIRGVLVGVTGQEGSDLPAEIERVDPVPDAVRVLAQTSVFVDLAAGYTGRLVVDGQEIETVGIDELGNSQIEPGQQVALPPATIYEPGNATLTFTPTAGAPVEEFGEGLHEATVIFWRIEDGPSRARSYSWTFNTV